MAANIEIKKDGFKILSIEENVKKYTSELSDNDIKGFVWYNRTLGIPMTGWEKWFIKNTSDNTVKATKDVDFLNQQYEVIGKFQKGDVVGKVTKFENTYDQRTYVAVRRFDNSLCLVDKSFLGINKNYEVSTSDLVELVKSKSLMYLNGQFMPLHVYTNTDYDTLRRQLDLDKAYIISEFGQDIYDYHKEIISGYISMMVNHPIKDKRYKLNPFGAIARETMTTMPDSTAEESVSDAFLSHARQLKSSEFELVSKDVFRDRILNNNDRISVRAASGNKEMESELRQKGEKELADANLECERLFSNFLSDYLDADTVKVLNIKINETYNRSILVNTSKIPVGFKATNKLKLADFTLKPVQVEAFKFAISRNNFCAALTVGFGKGHLLTSNILSPNGYRKMGDIKVGDDVVGKNGKPTKVDGVFPLGKVQCYRVTFSDGSFTEVSDEHLWSVQTVGDKSGKWDTVETKNIKDQLYDSEGNYRYSIPMVDPIEFEHKEVPVDPYLLGQDCAEYLQSVPEEYKINSTEVRFSVLMGLINGIKKNNPLNALVFFNTIRLNCNNDIKEDVLYLVQSLGGVCNLWNYSNDFNIEIHLPDNIIVNQFGKYELTNELDKDCILNPIRFIKSIEDIGFHEAQCIKVDAEDELYVCESFIVTHNTSVMICILSYLMETGTIKKPLVIVPKPVMKNWQKELFGFWTNGKLTSFEPVKGWEQNYGILTDCGFNFFNIQNLNASVIKKTPALKKMDKCIVLGSYEAMQKMYISDQDVRYFVIERWKDLLEQSVKDGKEGTARESSKKISDLIEKLNRADRNAEIDILSLGFDSIYFDEAHRLKNLFSKVSADKTNRISSGFKGSPSDRSLRAFYITQYFHKIGGRIGFLTATPFSNSPLEVYTMLIFLNYSELVKNNVHKIVNFVEIFFNETIEYKVDSKNRIVSDPVMKNYKNKPILYKILTNTFIYKNDPAKADIKRPCIIRYPNKDIKLMLKQSPLQEMQRDALTGKLKTMEEYMIKYPEVEPYVDAFESMWAGMTSTDSKLGLGGKILSASKSSAVSPFCNSPFMLPFVTDEAWRELYEFSPKIKFTVDCVQNILNYHNSVGDDTSSFLIYMGIGRDILEPFKQALEIMCGFKRGLSLDLDEEEDNGKRSKITYDEVEIISGSADTDKEADRRERVGDLFNKGRVKVIIGTDTIKEGLNLQVNCATLFIITPTWNSTDIKQIEGRIHRQGNKFGYARIITPLVTRTLDSFIYQKYEEKEARLTDIWEDDGLSTTGSLEVEIKPEKQKELILDDAYEIAKIRAAMSERYEANSYDKLNDEFGLLKTAISKSTEYKYLVDYFRARLPKIKDIIYQNFENIKALLASLNTNSPTYLKTRKERLQILVDYYIEFLEKINKALETGEVVDMVNVFNGSWKRRSYILNFSYDKDEFINYCEKMGLKNISYLVEENIFKPIGLTEYYSYDKNTVQISDLSGIYADCFYADKFILRPEGLSVSSPSEELEHALQKLQKRVEEKIQSLEANYDVVNDYNHGFKITAKKEFITMLETTARLELDEENKLSKEDSKLAAYFTEKTNTQLSYKLRDVDLAKCDIPYTVIDINNITDENANIDKIPTNFKQYNKLYAAIKNVVLDLDTIKIGFYEKSGKAGDVIMPLAVEAQGLSPFHNALHLDGNRYMLIMEQNYKQNGDLMTDPRIDFAIYPEEKIAIPLNFEQNGTGYFVEYVQDGKIVNHKNINDTVKFCIDTWMPNLVSQGRIIGKKPEEVIEEVIETETKKSEPKNKVKTTSGLNTIGDKYFTDHPENVIGEMSISDFRNMIMVKGTKQNVITYFDKILKEGIPVKEQETVIESDNEEEVKTLTDPTEIKNALIELASKSSSENHFVDNVKIFGSSYGIDVSGSAIIEALGLKRDDVRYNVEQLHKLYHSSAVKDLKKKKAEERKAALKEMAQEKTLRDVDNIIALATKAGAEMDAQVAERYGEIIYHEDEDQNGNDLYGATVNYKDKSVFIPLGQFGELEIKPKAEKVLEELQNGTYKAMPLDSVINDVHEKMNASSQAVLTFEEFKNKFDNPLPHYTVNRFQIIPGVVGFTISYRMLTSKDVVLGSNQFAGVGYRMTYNNLLNPENVISIVETYGEEQEAYQRAYELYLQYVKENPIVEEVKIVEPVIEPVVEPIIEETVIEEVGGLSDRAKEILATGLDAYNKASESEKEEMIRQVRGNLKSNDDGLATIGMGSDEDMVAAGIEFLKRIGKPYTKEEQKADKIKIEFIGNDEVSTPNMSWTIADTESGGEYKFTGYVMNNAGMGNTNNVARELNYNLEDIKIFYVVDPRFSGWAIFKKIGSDRPFESVGILASTLDKNETEEKVSEIQKPVIEIKSRDYAGLLMEGNENGTYKIEVEFYPAYEEKLHGKIKNKELVESLKNGKKEIFDLQSESLEILNIIKNPKDVKRISWVIVNPEIVSIIGSEVDLKGVRKENWMLTLGEVEKIFEGQSKDVIANAIKKWRSNVDNALSTISPSFKGQDSKFMKSIKAGLMTVNDAKVIIESANLKVPKEILDLIKKENEHKETETVEVHQSSDAPVITDAEFDKAGKETGKGKTKSEKQEITEAINALKILAKYGDAEAKEAIKGLKVLLKYS